MKSKYLYGGLLCILLAAVSLFAFKGSVALSDDIDENGKEVFFAPNEPSIYAFRKDTLTNALKDTLAVSGTLASSYTYSIHVRLLKLTGTQAMKVYLDESNGAGAKNSGIYATGWTTIDSLTPSATATELSMLGTEVRGLKHRIRVSGTASATQTVAYTVNALYTRKY